MSAPRLREKQDARTAAQMERPAHPGWADHVVDRTADRQSDARLGIGPRVRGPQSERQSEAGAPCGVSPPSHGATGSVGARVHDDGAAPGLVLVTDRIPLA